jgi:hypothetical protein
MATVKLNVGGTHFETLKSTLMISEYFVKLFQFNNPVEPIFIDCDPEGFKHVLENMRFANYVIPTNFRYLCSYFMLNNKEPVEQTCDGTVNKYKRGTIGYAIYEMEVILSSSESSMIGLKKLMDIMRAVANNKDLKIIISIKIYVYNELSKLLGSSHIGSGHSEYVDKTLKRIGLGMIANYNSGDPKDLVKSIITLLKTNPKWELIQTLTCYDVI